MQVLCRRFAHDESGATAIEYGLIAALIALVMISGARSLGTRLSAKFGTIATAISTAS